MTTAVEIPASAKRPVRAGDAGWGNTWCWFYCAQWRWVLSQACAARPTGVEGQERLLRSLSLREKALGKGSVCLSSMGCCHGGPILEGAQSHGNQWPATGPHCVPGLSPTGHYFSLFLPFQCLILGLRTRVNLWRTLLKGNLTHREDFQVHFLPNFTFFL